MAEKRTPGRTGPQDVLQSRSAPFIDRAPLPIVEVQGSSHIVSYANSAFCTLLEKTQEELLGKSFAELVPGGNECIPLLDRVYQTEEAVTHTQGDPEAMASWLYAMWPALDPNEHPVGIIIQLARVAEFRQKATAINEALLIAGLRQHELTEAARKLNQQLQREIAERKQAQDELRKAVEQAQRATSVRDNILAIVSHDLKNPLSTILMSLTVMERAWGGDDRRKSKKQMGSIKHSADRMDRLIQDLLDTASIEEGKLFVEPRRLAVAPLVAEAIDAIEPLATHKSLHIRNELPADLPPVFADAGRLLQVFANLLGNAIKFTPGGGTITVRADTVGETVQFSVTDTGAGIPEGDLTHLFDRFWQARPTAREGTGLGLNIVRGIVVAHGGRIWVDSRVGAGSTFFFTLPFALRDDARVGRS
ncbi:MAG: ATP-binding protein [Polyangiaceae bacterium]